MEKQRIFRLFHDAVSRIQIDLAEIIAQKPCAEAVDRGDLRLVQQRLLFLQVHIQRVRQKTRRDRLPDALPHLGGCCPRERHDKKAVDIQRMLRIANHLNDALHKNRRLTASCRRRHENIMVSGRYDPSLLWCEFHS